MTNEQLQELMVLAWVKHYLKHINERAAQTLKAMK